MRIIILIIIKSIFIRNNPHRPLLKPKKYQLSLKMVYLKIQMSFALFAVTQLFVFVARLMKKLLEQLKKIAMTIVLITLIKTTKFRNSNKRKESHSKSKAMLPLFPPLLHQFSHQNQFPKRKRTLPKLNALKVNTSTLSSATETINYFYKLFETNENGFSKFLHKITCTYF